MEGDRGLELREAEAGMLGGLSSGLGGAWKGLGRLRRGRGR